MASGSAVLLPREEEAAEAEKFNEFLSSLPKEDRIPCNPLYRYQGFWYDPKFLHGMLLVSQRHAQPQQHHTSHVILLATTPKAGTTWLKALTYAIVNRTRSPPPNPNLRHHHPLLSNSPHHLVPFLEQLYVYSNTQSIPPHHPIIATHIPYSMLPRSIKHSNCNCCKIVYICRDTKDVVVSLWHFMAGWAENRGVTPLPLEDFFELFCAGVSEFGPFGEHVREYWEASLEQKAKVLFLKYEDLKRNTVAEVKWLAEFLGYGFKAEEEEGGLIKQVVKLCSFEKLSGLEANNAGALLLIGANGAATQIEHKLYFRQGEVGDYTNFLTPQMAQRLDGITQEKFEGLDVTFLD